MRMEWPGGKRFGFTVFDDPDGESLEAVKWVYPFLRDLGFRTTIGVWTLGPLRDVNCPGETCEDPDYLARVKALQADGFEIGYHLAAPHSCTREEVIRSLDRFKELFGRDPLTMANHFNADALYWGEARLTGGLRRGLYRLLTRGQTQGMFSGHRESSPSYWGDIAHKRIRYCRNLVYTDIDTLAAVPYMPYRDPNRPSISYWYSSTNGPDCARFVDAICEAKQDRLEESGGLCIMYTHFGKGFVQDGKLNPRFVELMTRLAAKQPWSVPTGPTLDYLREQKGEHTVTSAEIRRLEWKWLGQKIFLGTQ